MVTADGASAPLDATQLGLECSYDMRGVALATGNAANVGAIDPQLAGDTSIQPAVEAVSLPRRLSAMMPCHQW